MIERGSPEWFKLVAEVPAVRVVALPFMTAEERKMLAEKIAEKKKKRLSLELFGDFAAGGGGDDEA